jgi:hypothetical protein
MGIMITDKELSAAVTDIPNFQKDGSFDPAFYRQVLQANRTNPEMFEKDYRTDLLVEKVKRVVRDATVVTSQEVAESFPSVGTGKGQPPEDQERMKSFLQFQKQEKSLKAYMDALRAKADIKISKEVL